jgi:hypothetical protein
MLVTPPIPVPTCLAELTAVAHTMEAGQQLYYKAEQVKALAAALLGRVQQAEASQWVIIGGSLAEPHNLPTQGEKVLLHLVSGTYAVGQLNWTHRWLLQGGTVLLLQEVVAWKTIVAPETVKGGQQGA